MHIIIFIYKIKLYIEIQHINLLLVLLMIIYNTYYCVELWNMLKLGLRKLISFNKQVFRINTHFIS